MSRGDWQGVARLPIGLMERLNDLDDAIRAALKQQSKLGREKGASLLEQLAGGELTAADFNKATLEGDE